VADSTISRTPPQSRRHLVGIDWTQGAREMIGKFIGSGSHGNGKVAVLSAEYDFSVAPILWPAQLFWPGPGPARRHCGIAALHGCDRRPTLQEGKRYYLGLETEYRMTSLFSVMFKSYGESRDSTSDATASTVSIPASRSTPTGGARTA